jgi:hypothetical protein
MRKLLFFVFALVCCTWQINAQSYGVEVEVVTEHNHPDGDPLAVLNGMTTYRLYVTTESPTDFISACAGESINPLRIETTTTFYQDFAGGISGGSINPLLYAFSPTLVYDSWITIGRESMDSPGASINLIEGDVSWQNPFEGEGQSIIIDDLIGGAWFALNTPGAPDVNAIAGDDLRVLVGQFTTDGTFSGVLYCQIFPNGVGADEFRINEPFGVSVAVQGCTSVDACNFNAAATEDDGSCVFPTADCTACGLNGGLVLVDADGDGVCDADEIVGCISETACNFNPDATDSDATTLCIEPVDGCQACNDSNDGLVIVDADGDGVCDAEEIAGCTDDSACNFDVDATDDNGSCDFSCQGCTNPEACNFDPNASVENGSCEFDSCAGCTNPEACNFNADATIDNGSCDFTSCAGCTDALACNFDADASIDNGSCDFSCYGCTDDNACNFDATATLSDDSCEYISCAGCTNPAALNFDATATIDDGSCEFDNDTCTIICPEDVVVECTDDASIEATGAPMLMGDCTGVVTELVGEVLEGDECFSVYTRTWLIEDTTTGFTQSCEQRVTVIDTEGPVFTDVPADLTVQCLEEVPAQGEASAEDACNGVDDITIFTSETGNPVTTCVASTANGPGGSWALWLPVLEAEGVTMTDEFASDGTLSFVQYADGTAHLSGTVARVGFPNQAFEVSVWLQNGRTWDQWSALGRGYKDSFGFGTQDNNFEDWTYYEMVNGFSTITGIGDYAGAVLYLSHMPSSFFYGFQCGLGANDRNGNFGMSGWFTYTGLFNNMPISGHGDFNLDKECVPNNEQDCPNRTEVTYFWRATDDCGNASIASQVITVFDDIAPEFTVVPEDLTVECDAPAVPVFEGVEATDNCEGDVVIVYLGEESATEGCTTVLTRTWAATDLCGNRAEHQQTITVVDTTAPEVTFVPEDLTVECDQEIPVVLAEGVDNCQDVVTVTYSDEETQGDCPQEYTITRTFFLNDGCENISTATQMISVVDTTSPVFDEYPIQVSVECNEVESVPTLTATDNCGEVTVTFVETLNSGGCIGVLYRVYTATDECGNEATAEQFITLTDNTAPIIENPADATVECDNVPEAPGAEGIEIYDNCGFDVEVTFTEEITEGLCEDAYTITWTWVAIDLCENESTASTTITVIDTTPPVYETVPEDATVECSDELPAVVFPTAFDNCDQDVNIELTEEIIDGDCPQEYTLNRIFRAFDNCGNSTMFVQTINVVDTTAPVFAEPADETFECSDEITVTLPSATDNCGEVTVSFSDGEQVPGECANEYSFTRTYTAIDECGNESSTSNMIFVVDTTAPVFAAYEVEIDMPCDNIMPTTLEATDNCGDVEVSYEDTPVSGGCAGRIIRDYTAVDACGNEATAQQIITLIDEVAPVWTLFPADVTVECDNVPSNDGIEVAFEDNCDDEPVLEYNGEVIIDGACEDSYTIERTWTITDQCDNATPITWTITVIDTTAPEFTEVAADVTVECDEELPAPFAAAVDNCDDSVSIEVSGEMIDGECANEYTMVRTYTATDNCGNVATATQTITVVDTTAPVIAYQGGELTLECDQVVELPEVTATDNCGEATVSMEMSMDNGQCENERIEVYTWTAVDACGNESESVSLFVYYEDTTAPVFDAYDIEIDMPCDNIENTTVTATDNCGDVEITFIDTPVSGGCAGRIIRDFTAVDACGNEATAQQIITLVDEVAPVWTLFPADVTVECDNVPSNDGIEVDFEDNCSDNIDLVYNGEVIIDGACENSYTIERTWTITDQCDNATPITWTITVVDTTAPVFTEVAADVTVECDEELPAPFAAAVDNCDDSVSIEVSGEMIDGECANEYTMVRTYTATDNCGNVATATQTITVVDTTAPVIAYQGGELTLECDQVVELPLVTATDNCGEATVSMEMSMDNGQCENERIEVYTWTAVDACGNESESVSLFVYYEDTTAPVFDAFDVEIDMPCDNITETTVTATDNCGDVEITYVDTPVSGGCAGRIIRDFTAVDACGNEATVQQIITLVDEVAPVWTLFPADVTVECDNVPSNDGIEVAFEDNCDDELDLVYNGEVIIDGVCENSYTIERTWTITDNCDNSTPITWTITVQDTTAPVLSLENDEVTIECDMAIELPQVSAEDNCDADVTVVMDMEEIDGVCANERTVIYTWTATDNCGNTDVAVWTINVVDTTAPEFTSVPESNELSCEDAIPTVMATATDNCGEAVVSMEDMIIDGDCPQSYTIVRTWTATDACGNTTTATTEYFIFDDVAPVFTSTPSNISVQCASDVPAMEAPEATDNCGVATVICSTEVIEEDDCGNYSAIVTCVATDECGNSSQISYTIDVLDTTAPALMDTPADLVLDCEDDVPAAVEVTAMDNCDNDIMVSFSEELFGDVPAEGSIADCNLTTPQAFNEDGTVCTGDERWSLLLFEFDNAAKVFYSTVEANFVEYPDGTATLTGSVVRNDDPSRGWDISVEFADGMDWSMWSTQGFPTSYKDDCGLAGDNYLDWTYYIMQAGATLTGWGANDGSTLMLSHAPSNLYYGYQVGVAADNVNTGFGSGGWFTYSGIYNGENVIGSGDFAFEHDCCPDYSIERTWCAVDCSGNETCYTQTITFDDLGIDPPIVNPIGAGEAQVSKGDFDIVKVSPNPAVERTNIEFVSKVNTTVIMEVYDLSGRVVATLYQGNVFEGETYRTTFNTSQLESGMYTIRLASTTSAKHQKLSVQK